MSAITQRRFLPFISALKWYSILESSGSIHGSFVAFQLVSRTGYSIPDSSAKLNVNPKIATLSRPVILMKKYAATIDVVRVHFHSRMC